MNALSNSVLTVIALRAAALAATLAGRPEASASLYALADLIESGRQVDAHLAEVAAKLKERELNDADWADVRARIEADSARLQSDD